MSNGVAALTPPCRKRSFQRSSIVKDDLKTVSMTELQAALGSTADGLSQADAQKRLTQYGPNELEEKKTNPFLKFLSYFWGPIPWMIEILSRTAGRRPGLREGPRVSSSEKARLGIRLLLL